MASLRFTDPSTGTRREAVARPPGPRTGQGAGVVIVVPDLVDGADVEVEVHYVNVAGAAGPVGTYQGLVVTSGCSSSRTSSGGPPRGALALLLVGGLWSARRRRGA